MLRRDFLNDSLTHMMMLPHITFAYSISLISHRPTFLEHPKDRPPLSSCCCLVSRLFTSFYFFLRLINHEHRISSEFPFSVTCWSSWHDSMSFSFMSLLFWGGHYQRFGFMTNRWLRWMLPVPMVCIFFLYFRRHLP